MRLILVMENGHVKCRFMGEWPMSPNSISIAMLELMNFNAVSELMNSDVGVNEL